MIPFICVSLAAYTAVSLLPENPTVAALADVTNTRVPDLITLDANKACFLIYNNTGPTSGNLSNPLAAMELLVGPICPQEHVTGLNNHKIISIKALDFSRNGKVDLLVSLATDTIHNARVTEEVVNLLYLSVGEENSKFGSKITAKTYPDEGNYRFYAPVKLHNTYEPPIPMMINKYVDAPDLVYPSDNKTLSVFINTLANYNDEDVIIDCINGAVDECFSTTSLYALTDPNASLSFPMDVSQIDLEGGCVAQIAVKVSRPCSVISQDLNYMEQQSTITEAYNSVNTNSFLPYTGDAICEFLDMLHITFTSTSQHTPYVLDEEHSFLLGSGVGALTFFDVNGNGAIDIVYPVCRGKDCIEENSIHILYNEQMKVCWADNAGSTCRTLGEMCTPDLDYTFNADPEDVVIINIMKIFTGDNWKVALGQVPEVVRISILDKSRTRRPTMLVPLTDGSKTMMVMMNLSPCENGEEGVLEVTPDYVLGCPKYIQPSATNKERFYPTSITLNDIPDEENVDIHVGAFIDLLYRGNFLLFLNNKTNTIILESSQVPKGYGLFARGLNDLCIESCGYATPSWSFISSSTIVPGITFKYVTSDLFNKVVGVGTQLASLTYNPLETPYLFWGISDISQYIEAVYAGNIFGERQRDCYNSWSGVVPNSFIEIFQYPVDAPKSWIIKAYLPAANLTQIALLTCASILIGTLLLTSVGLYCCENKRDKREEKELESSLYRDEL
ncbi:hypothetical protein GMRT_10273 [Giardia muris]|uniref:T-cell immunomodulatory protein TIP C2 domain-containing protein n=1 Tax=Giardia muris TaxID=5742 RepID=A0A4Z1SX79_GIAMU|nr:hypothetical protein GMRT_10273 [Giardia muris]|eukprot:TNJ29435.1 hypothetical protein GMRT_10273 [Giardia muris]